MYLTLLVFSNGRFGPVVLNVHNEYSWPYYWSLIMAIEDLLGDRNFLKPICPFTVPSFGLNPGQNISQACRPVYTSKAQPTARSNILY